MDGKFKIKCKGKKSRNASKDKEIVKKAMYRISGVGVLSKKE